MSTQTDEQNILHRNYKDSVFRLVFGEPEKMIELARAIGLEISGDKEKDKLLLAGALKDLCVKLGIRTLKEQNVPEEAFDRLAEDVLKEPVLGFNPRQGVTKEDVIEILKKAY